MGSVTELFADARRGLPFDGLVFSLGADGAAVDGGQHANGRAGRDQRETALKCGQEGGAKQQGGDQGLFHSSTPNNKQSMASQRQCTVSK